MRFGSLRARAYPATTRTRRRRAGACPLPLSRQAAGDKPLPYAKVLRGAVLCVGCLTLLLAAMIAPSARADGGQLAIVDTRTTSFPRISLRMSASDLEGLPIEGLKSSDFEVLENGQPAIDTFLQTVRQSSTPLSIVLLVDVSGSMRDQGKLDSAREAANSFISGLRRIDQVEIIGFSSKVITAVPFTSDRGVLAAGLQKLTPAGDTALYDALYAGVGEASRKTGNRVVLALTDGEDTASKSQFQQPVDLAAQLGIPVYTIGLGQEVKDDVLRAVAEGTSGRYLKAPGPGDLVHTFRLLSHQIQNQYELTYISSLPESTSGNVNVSVTARLAGQPVVAKFSYLIPQVVNRDAGGVLETGQLREVPLPPLPRPPSFRPTCLSSPPSWRLWGSPRSSRAPFWYGGDR